jgi:hypothetical protein
MFDTSGTLYLSSLSKSEITSGKPGDSYLVISRGGNQHWFVVLESPVLTPQTPSGLMYGAVGMPLTLLSRAFLSWGNSRMREGTA